MWTIQFTSHNSKASPRKQLRPGKSFLLFHILSLTMDLGTPYIAAALRTNIPTIHSLNCLWKCITMFWRHLHAKNLFLVCYEISEMVSLVKESKNATCGKTHLQQNYCKLGKDIRHGWPLWCYPTSGDASDVISDITYITDVWLWQENIILKVPCKHIPHFHQNKVRKHSFQLGNNPNSYK